MSTDSRPQLTDECLPAVLHLAEVSDPVEVSGNFDVDRQTWSNRSFECAAKKKHNESM